jgi:uncharacterized protein (TIGR02996 family)
MPGRLNEVKVPGGFPSGSESFLAAVVADRGDDTVRLAFADWLEENGNPDRARFIRDQIALSRIHPNYEDAEVRVLEFGPDDHERYRREREALVQHGRIWHELPQSLAKSTRLTYRRGFPAAIHCSTDIWADHGEYLRRWLPLESVSLEGGATTFVKLVSHPSLFGLSELSLTRVGTRELRALTGSPVLDTIESLHLRGRERNGTVGNSVLRGLFGSSRLARLRRLRVWFDRSGDTLGSIVGGSPHLRNLELLELSDAMRAEAAQELFDSPNLAGVTYLDLSNNPFGDSAIRGLVRSRYLTRLTTLVVQHAGLTAESGRLLGGWPGLRTLTGLNLYGNRLELEGIRGLSESPYLSQLRWLILRVNLPYDVGDVVRGLPGFVRLPGLTVAV